MIKIGIGMTPPPNLGGDVGGLVATGITKSYRRGLWPRRRELAVHRGGGG